jgi:hypothetical protein
MSAVEQAKRRGSEQLRALHGDRHGLDTASLALIDEVLSNDSIQLLGWQRRGVPVIDSVVGTFLTGRDGAADIVKHLGRDRVAWGIVVFPYGVPAVEFLTVVEATRDAGAIQAGAAGAPAAG